MPDDIFRQLKSTWVSGKTLDISRHREEGGVHAPGARRPDAGDRPVKRKPRFKGADKSGSHKNAAGKKSAGKKPAKKNRARRRKDIGKRNKPST
jgi:hypothetical protein